MFKDDLIDEDWRVGEKHWQRCSERRGWVEQEEEKRDDVERHCSSSVENAGRRKDSGPFIRRKRRRLKSREEKEAKTESWNFKWHFGSTLFSKFLAKLSYTIF